jgi:hypothetical protein
LHSSAHSPGMMCKGSMPVLSARAHAPAAKRGWAWSDPLCSTISDWHLRCRALFSPPG